MREVIFLPGAQADYEQALQWYHDRSPQASTNFETAIEAAIAAIVAKPERWATLGQSHRRYIVDGFPHSIVYRIDPNAIMVVAVAHGSRRPGYWKRRK